MPFGNRSPRPHDSDDFGSDPRDPSDGPAEPRGGPGESGEDEGAGADPETWAEGLEDDLDEVPENDQKDDLETEISAQPDDPDGVSRGMATVALNPNVLQGGGAQAGRAAGRADWKAMSDAEIMLRVREGDDAAFNFLIEKYRKAIVNFMYRMVHNQSIAEELAQDVFLRVYRSRETYRAEAKFTTWLYRIATNLGVNYARDTKNERSAQTIYLDQPDQETGTTPDVADMHASAEEELVRDERMRAIRKHVMALPERQRTAVLMHKYQGLDYKEIGAVLHLSESATKSLLFRAYQTLRERLKEFVEQG
ncbi:MAG TPA: RNA polymerase sigma factor [Acidobacteriaceae bacterium]|nr:RNA polymerase sigma factor [Acidobacteriaceae bacterium]